MLLVLLFGLSSCFDKTRSLKPLKVVCLGDSITYGYKLPDRVAQSYPSQLAKLSHGQWQVLNSGVNGATLLHKGDIPITAQKAYQRAIRFQPDVVILLLGSNDTKDKNWKYIDEFIADHTKLVETIRDLPSHPHVITCSIPPIFGYFSNGLNEKRAKEVNGLLAQSVAASKADVLDIYTPMSQKPSFFVDGIHPNISGARKIAGLVFDKISGL